MIGLTGFTNLIASALRRYTRFFFFSFASHISFNSVVHPPRRRVNGDACFHSKTDDHIWFCGTICVLGERLLINHLGSSALRPNLFHMFSGGCIRCCSLLLFAQFSVEFYVACAFPLPPFQSVVLPHICFQIITTMTRLC